PMPPWLVELWGASKGGGKGRSAPPPSGAKIREGARDTALTSKGGGMRRRGFDEEEIRAALTLHNARCCEPPLPEEQVAKIARSVARYAPEDTALVKVVGAGRADATQPPWPDPLPLGRAPAVPAFPAHRLPGWQRDWAVAAARATQTPPDLAGMLVFGIAGAALAGKVRVEVRPGWDEPINVYTATALLVGERKSAVFRAALDPVLEYERQEVARLTPLLASRASARRVLEGRLTAPEARAPEAAT